MRPNRTGKIASIGGALWVLVFMVLAVEVQAYTDLPVPAKVYVGIFDAPPFAMKTADGRWEGFSVELWHAVAHNLGIGYELREYCSIEHVKATAKEGDLDVLVVAAQTKENETLIDFSDAYYRSGSAIAVAKQGGGHGWLGFVRNFFSRGMLSIVCLLILLWLIAGGCIFFIENRRNREMFGGGCLRGLGHGIWWAAVTMTTVGYGDKAPRTLGGRIVAIIWMFASIILISSFTAAITTHLTVGELRGKVRGLQDLPSVRVGSVAQSESLDFLTNRGIVALPFETEREGLQAIADDRIDALVYDASVLKHVIKSDFSSIAQVLPGTFDVYYVGLGLATGSPLREPVNRALLNIMDTEVFTVLINRYFGLGG